MGRKKSAEPRQEKSAKLDGEIHNKAKMVAFHKKKELFDYINELLGPLVDRDYQQMLQDASRTSRQK